MDLVGIPFLQSTGGTLAIRRETLWNNRMITNGRGKTLHWTQWKEVGIYTINHSCHAEEGRIFSHEEIQQKFLVVPSWMSLRMGISLHWHSSIIASVWGYTNRTFEASFVSGVTIDISPSSADHMSAEIVSAKEGVVNAQRKWDYSADIQRPFKTR